MTWTTTYNGLLGGDDQGRGIAVDGSGVVYAAGFETVGGQGENIWVRKYTNATPPQEMWTRSQDGPSNANDRAKSVAQDGTGVYVSGFQTSGGLDLFAGKLAQSNGLPVWTTTYAGNGGGTDEGESIAINVPGDVFVAGFESRSGQGSDILLRKFNSDAFGSGVAAINNLAAAANPVMDSSIRLTWTYPATLPPRHHSILSSRPRPDTHSISIKRSWLSPPGR